MNNFTVDIFLSPPYWHWLICNWKCLKIFYWPNTSAKSSSSLGYKSFNNCLPNDNLSTAPECSYVISTRDRKKEANPTFRSCVIQILKIAQFWRGVAFFYLLILYSMLQKARRSARRRGLNGSGAARTSPSSSSTSRPPSAGCARQGCGSAFISSRSSILGWKPIRIRIQSGSRALMTKIWKKLQLKKKFNFFDQKLQFTYL